MAVRKVTHDGHVFGTSSQRRFVLYAVSTVDNKPYIVRRSDSLDRLVKERASSEYIIDHVAGAPVRSPLRKGEKVGTKCECGASYVYLPSHDSWGYACAR